MQLLRRCTSSRSPKATGKPSARPAEIDPKRDRERGAEILEEATAIAQEYVRELDTADARWGGFRLDYGPSRIVDPLGPRLLSPSR